MAFVTLEDTQTKAEVVIFPSLFSSIEGLLTQYSVFLVKGTLDSASTTLKIKAQHFIPFDTLFSSSSIKALHLHMPPTVTRNLVTIVKEQLKPGPIALNIVFAEHNQTVRLKSRVTIELTAALLSALEQHNITTRIEMH